MSKVQLIEWQIINLRELLRLNENQKTLRIYCRMLVYFMEKRKALTSANVSA